MKKTIGIATGITAALSLALPAYATVNVDPCANMGTLAALCNLKSDKFGSLVGEVVTVLLILAALIALFFLIWGGIRWITSSGDKAKVEAARNTIISALIGLIIAFLAYFILTVILGLFGLNTTQLTLPNFTQ